MLKEALVVGQAELTEEWRNRLSRQQSSDQSKAAFCRTMFTEDWPGAFLRGEASFHGQFFHMP